MLTDINLSADLKKLLEGLQSDSRSNIFNQQFPTPSIQGFTGAILPLGRFRIIARQWNDHLVWSSSNYSNIRIWKQDARRQLNGGGWKKKTGKQSSSSTSCFYPFFLVSLVLLYCIPMYYCILAEAFIPSQQFLFSWLRLPLFIGMPSTNATFTSPEFISVATCTTRSTIWEWKPFRNLLIFDCFTGKKRAKIGE